MKQIKFKIQSEKDRENMLIALANNGYKVYVKVQKLLVNGDVYFVIVEHTNPKEEL